MALFGRKKDKFPSPGPEMPPGAPPGNFPVDQVVSMRQQGMSNNDIIQNLQSQGFKSHEIFDAMSQADISQPAGPQMQPPPMQPSMEQWAPPAMFPPGMPPPMEQSPIEQGVLSAPEKERIEEVAEAIIDEKWKDLMGDINKVIEWKRIVDSRLDKLEQLIKDLKSNFDNLHKGVLGRISEYDKNLTDVGVEIKAMEKVFQKILPTFTENVNKLSRLVKK